MLLQPMHKTYTDKIRVISLNMPCLSSSNSCSRTSYIMYNYNLWCRFLWSCPQSYETPQFPLVTYLFVYLWYHLSLLRFIENQKFGLCHERHHLKDSIQIKTLSLLKNFTFERFESVNAYMWRWVVYDQMRLHWFHAPLTKSLDNKILGYYSNFNLISISKWGKTFKVWEVTEKGLHI